MSGSVTVTKPDADGLKANADLAVGRRVRLLRHRGGRSLQELATATGLSIGLISQIERGLSSPSVKNLVALGEALGVGLSWFFDETVSLDDAETRLVVRREVRHVITMGDGGVEKQLLSPDPDRHLQLFLIWVEPGGSTGDGFYSHTGESVGMVLSGSLVLSIEGRDFLLREGDSFSVPANAPRRFSNPDARQHANILWSVARSTAAGASHDLVEA